MVEQLKNRAVTVVVRRYKIELAFPVVLVGTNTQWHTASITGTKCYALLDCMANGRGKLHRK